MRLGEQILKLRKQRGLSRRELSELSGVSESAIKQYETGKRQPRIELLRNLAKALNVPLGDLVGAAAADGCFTAEEMWNLKENDSEELQREALYEEFFKTYSELGDEEKNLVVDFVEMLTKRNKPEDEEGDTNGET